MRTSARMAWCGWLVVAAAPVWAGPAAFTLERAVPQGVCVYNHSVPNPEHQFADDLWASVWRELWDTKIDEDIRDLISSLMATPADSEAFNTSWDELVGLVKQLEFSELFGHETMYLGRMRLPQYEHLVVTRTTEAIVERNAPRVRAVLDKLAELYGGQTAHVTETTVQGATVWSLSLHPAMLPICAAYKGDVLAVGLGQHLLGEVLELLSGGEEVPRLIDDPRFKQVMRVLPSPEDGRSFVDVRAMIESLDGFFGSLASRATEDEHDAAVLAALRAAVRRCDLVDYTATVTTTEDRRVVTHTIISLVPAAMGKPLYGVFCKQKLLRRIERYIPEQATSFSASAGLDLGALYRQVLAFVREDWPGGTQILADWRELQNELRFHPDKDLFDWLDGRMVRITLPASHSEASTQPAPDLTGQESATVVMLGVRDPKLAARKVKAALDRLSNALANLEVDQADPTAMFKTMFRLPLTSQPARNVPVKGFRKVSHPICSAFFNPVYGVWGDWLVIGTSEEAIASMIATARGKHPNIQASERFQREGLRATGPVFAVSYSDLSHVGEEIGQMLDMLRLIGGITKMSSGEQAGRILQDLLVIIGKLGPLARKVDFLQSKASITTFDGKAWRTRSVLSYKPPAPPTTRPAAPAGKASR